MARSGYADLPLHHGTVPRWLAERMSRLGGAIVEAIVLDYGQSEMLKRLSDPTWFQAFGCVLGMDWHSSGITTSVMGALKRSVNPMSKDLGIFICGGRGKHSRNTPAELLALGDKTGLDGNHLVRCSRLSAKIDNTAIQDGFQIYLHNFIVTDKGEWSVVQQGMNNNSAMARRYHWHSSQLESFINSPHTSIYGQNQGLILNLTDGEADVTRQGILNIAREDPAYSLPEIRKVVMPRHHDVKAKDVNLKRLGAVLALAQDLEHLDFENFLLLGGLGPRTLQSLVMVSEIIHGTPSRFNDPARFSFAHGGKDGHPFPVPTKVYDETIDTLRSSLSKAKIGHTDKQKAMQSLTGMAQQLEKDFAPNARFEDLIEKERAESHLHGGRTVFGWAEPPPPKKQQQLSLF